jgi:hypothetical protein
VVLPWTAPLHVAPRRTARQIHLHDPNGVWRAGPPLATSADASPWPQSGYELEVVGSAGEFLAVKPVRDREGVCAPSMPGMSWWDVTFYVEKSAPLAVLTRTVRAEFADGTAVELAPGVRVGAEVGVDRARGAKEYAIEADGARLVVAVSEDAIGRVYTGTAAFPAVGGDRALDGDARLLYDGGRVVHGFSHGYGCEPVRVVDGPGTAGQYRIEARSRCMWLRVDVAAQHLPAIDAVCDPGYSVGGLELVGSRESTLYRLSDGAELFWPDGERAGTARSTSDRDSRPREVAGRICFDLTEGFVWREPVTVCAEPDDVRVFGQQPRPVQYDTSCRAPMTGYGRGGPPAPPKCPPAPPLRIGELSVQGSLDAGLLARAVRENSRSLQHCYQSCRCDLDGNPLRLQLAGRFAVEFVIGAEGTVVKSAVAHSSVPEAGVTGCFVETIEQWRFPAPERGRPVVVEVPFEFGP